MEVWCTFMDKVLVIAAHPDDEVLGCGGALLQHHQKGDEIYIIYISEGTSASNVADIFKRKRYAQNAMSYVDAKRLVFLDYPDQRLDDHPILSINKDIEDAINDISPDIVYIHTQHDNNKDHRIAYESSIIATRGISKILAFEIPGSTNNNFKPNRYIPFTEENYSMKSNMFIEYRSEVQDMGKPRSLHGLDIHSKYRGIQCSKWRAEAFEVIRWVEDI